MRLVALAAALALVGCGGSDASTAPARSGEQAAKRGCEGTTPARVKGRPLSGDVDGDGAEDRVTLRTDRKRPPRCRYVLAVETGAGATMAARVRPLAWPGTNPRLLLLAEIDGHAGLEPVVSLSPANVYRPGAVFTLRGERLVRMRLKGRRTPALFPLADEFPSTTDCAGEPGRIVVTVPRLGNPDSNWRVTRTTYRAVRRSFEPVATERFRVRVGDRVVGAPFESC